MQKNINKTFLPKYGSKLNVPVNSKKEIEMFKAGGQTYAKTK